MKKNLTPYLAIVLALGVAALDQFSKNMVMQMGIAEHTAMPITSFLNLVLVYNHGISFGMFNRAPHEYQPLIFLGIAAIISIILLIWLFRTRSGWISVALGLIIGGAIGNSIDRVQYGAVVDFIDVYATFNGAPYHWPSFNVADSGVVCGVIMLLIHSLAFDKLSPQK